MRALSLAAIVIGLVARTASAQSVPEPDAGLDAGVPDAAPPEEPHDVEVPVVAPPAPPAPITGPGLHLREVQIHGFVSEGGFVSTANDYIGSSSHGSLKLFEAGINFSTEVTDRLRAGMQIFAREFGTLEDSPRVDWAFLDYGWRSWLGIRAGVIKMPFGLYNEYADIDAARVPILLPQSVYPFQNRDVLLSHTGFSIYGNVALGGAGDLDYQVWLGTLSIPNNALNLAGATLDSIDTKYVTGAQVFWHLPVEGLRVGATVVRTSIDFNLTLDDANIAALIAAGIVPAGYSGALVVSQRPDLWAIGSAEYVHGDWMFAAEYSRALKHQQTTLPAALPAFDQDEERFYGMATYRPASWAEVGGYYSVHYADVHDRNGDNPMYAEKFDAWQRDLAATIRFDVNDHWLWKLEGHFMDGAADLPPAANPHPERYWGLLLMRTTVTF